MKIKKIRITNFKVFEDYLFDFGKADFLIFDGPNGFGKTSFYDAVELLITGRIRRYVSLSDVMLAGRSTFNENPYRYSGAPNGDIEIRGEIEINGEIYFISRKCLNVDIKPSASFDDFRLYSLSSLEDDLEELVDDEPEFMVPLFGANYTDNFEFLNYIEQEENAYLLKNKDKDKLSLISHLFNVADFQREMDRVSGVRKKIATLFSAEQKLSLKQDEDGLKVLKNAIAAAEATDYNRVFADYDYFWDADTIDFGNHSYQQLIGEDGKLSSLQLLLSRKDDFQAYRFNDRIDKVSGNRRDLELFLNYVMFYKNREAFLRSLRLNSDIEHFLSLVEEIENIDLGETNMNVPESISHLIPEELLDGYTGNLAKLKSSKSCCRGRLF